jgi:hypothetical protein
MAQNKKAQSFLDAMSKGPPQAETPAASINGGPGGYKVSSDPRRKHIGGYFDPDFVEKFAVLKARLDLDNSELIKRAIDSLWADEEARRAFGDQ